MSDTDRRSLTVRVSRFSHEKTLERLTAAVTRHGATVFSIIDHAANAAANGLELPPTTVVIFGNAAVGTPLMRSEPNLALDLPSRVLVRVNEAGTVDVVYLNPTALAQRHGLNNHEIAGLTGLIGIINDALRHQ